MKRQVWVVVGLLLSGTALPALAEQPMAGMEMKKEAVQAAPQGAGKVVSIDRTKGTIKLAHGAIKSLGWPGMTMDFKVASNALLEGIKAGDAVTFGLEKDTGGKWQIIRIAPKDMMDTRKH